MHVIFVRHGERRGGESDPELTSWGRKMAAETGRWLRDGGWRPTLLRATPTARTRQTAAEIEAALGEPVPREEGDVPEFREDWDALIDQQRARLGGGAVLTLVGHHPTLEMLLRAFGPAPRPIPRQHFASALVLADDEGGRWRCIDAWPGRPGG